MAVYNNLPGSPIITVSDTSNASVSVGTTETTLLTITAPLSGKYLILATTERTATKNWRKVSGMQGIKDRRPVQAI